MDGPVVGLLLVAPIAITLPPSAPWTCIKVSEKFTTLPAGISRSAGPAHNFQCNQALAAHLQQRVALV
jgi:hypothetical protein